MKILPYFAVALLLTVATLSPIKASAQPLRGGGATRIQLAFQTGGPEVIQAWVDALDSHNVDLALSLLADEPFLILDSSLGNGIATYSGKSEIAELLQGYVSDNIQVRLERAPQEENGTTFWTESRTGDTLAKAGVSVVEYTGEALINDGKIVSLIYTPTPESEAAIVKALGTQPTGMPSSGVAANDGIEWDIWIAIGLWSVLVGGSLLVFNGREERRYA